jgi:hypothetical protein
VSFLVYSGCPRAIESRQSIRLRQIGLETNETGTVEEAEAGKLQLVFAGFMRFFLLSPFVEAPYIWPKVPEQLVIGLPKAVVMMNE